ncbi:MAG: hypothetical protein OEL77_05030 [Nitrosopumilus sp.]|nr:hypothetical protein [Nitrosopumilus sp.]MDH3385357.1 hypothetical protein [Nitrosopumilus sp.]
MTHNNPKLPIIFFAEKIHVHRWPMNSPVWSKSTTEKIEGDLNKNFEKKKVTLNDDQIQIENYCFKKIKKVGITVPLFKKRTTMVFEGHFEDGDAHIHVTTYSQNYLEVFNTLMSWQNSYFPDSQ